MFIGIDLGTTGVKIILVNASGDVIAKTTESYPLSMPKPLWTEQNPEDWYNQTIKGLKKVVKGYEKDIEAISFSGQMHGLVILDNNDHVIRPALLWNDQRTTQEVRYLNETIGTDVLQQETGNIALTGLTAPKLLWVKNNEPALFQKIKKIMLPKDYLLYRLSGVFATDVSDISGSLFFDIKNKRYSQTMLDVLNIKETQLPTVFESYEKVGHLLEEVKNILQIHQPVKVIAGGGDQAVGAIGVGTVSPGKSSMSLGTSGVVYVATNKFQVDTQSHLQSYRDSTGHYLMMGVILNAAGSLKWWNEKIFKEHDYDKFFEELNYTSIADSLYFLPYLSGERAPINDSTAKGMFFGLQAHHEKGHMHRALVEGITYALKESFDLIQNLGTQIVNIRITGGGAKSAIWAQMIADVMNVDVEVMSIDEGPALGAAILAMVGNGTYPSVSVTCEKLLQVKETFYPIKDNVALYEKKYNVYKKLYETVKPLYNII
ncbi:MAG: xylulokinase [Acholeplasmataceae bacterium]|nr:xylulokinase [Acholeplasmataceae bacterium]